MESLASQTENDKTHDAGSGLGWKRRVLVFWSSTCSIMLSVADNMDDVPSAIPHGEAMAAMTTAPFLALRTAVGGAPGNEAVLGIAAWMTQPRGTLKA